MDYLFNELSYKIINACFVVHNHLGPTLPERFYQRALVRELSKDKISFEVEKLIDIKYDGDKIGQYRVDFVVDDKIILEIKAIPFLTILAKRQLWHYLKGSRCKLALLVNFGGPKVEIYRRIYDIARNKRG